MYSRNIESDLRAALADTRVVLLNGARQTGKSTLVTALSGELGADYVTLDDATVLSAASTDPAGFLKGLSSRAVIDEVQKAPALFPAIKTLVDTDRRPGRFLLTGSANVLMLPKISESLAGRMEIITLNSLSQGELLGRRERFIDGVFAAKISALAREDARDLATLVLAGGYPEAVQRTAGKRRAAWFASCMTAILQRDVRDLAHIEGLTEMPRLLTLLIRLVEQFVAGDWLVIPSLFHQEPLRKRILLALNVDIIVHHLLRFLREQNQERIEPVFDEESPIGSTRHMRTWYTTKVCYPTQKSQISHMIADSAWEQYAANVLEKSDRVTAYAKNDHLGFQVYYLWNGARRRFVPDFLIRLANGKTLVLEIKGEDSEQNRAKREALDAWVKGMNAKGGFGTWCWDVAFQPAQIHDIILKHTDEGLKRATPR